MGRNGMEKKTKDMLHMNSFTQMNRG